MELPEPTISSAQAVLGFKYPVLDRSRDEAFIAAAASHFPHRVFQQPPGAIAPPNAPFLVLASTSSQLAISPLQADFQVRFYGDYMLDVPRSVSYVRDKLDAMLAACEASKIEVSTLGVVTAIRFKADDLLVPPSLIQRVHLRTELAPESIYEATSRIAVKVRDIYYLNITAGTYETRSLQQPMTVGMGAVRVRPWDGEVVERGLELTLDVNNALEPLTTGSDPTITTAAVAAIMGLIGEFAANYARSYMSTGELPLDKIEASSRPVVA